LPRLDGIDVSHWDGTVDWRAVGGVPSIQLVAAKATEGRGDRDPLFVANWTAIRALGFRVRIAYHFATGDPPEDQAAWFATTITDAGGPLLPGEGVMVDIEPSPPLVGELPVAQLAALLGAIESSTGRTPLRYMGEYYPGAGDPALSRFPLWLPDYTWDGARPSTALAYAIWQWGGGEDGAFVPGIGGGSTRVDSDEVVDWPTVERLVQLTP
jgi:lysozyme